MSAYDYLGAAGDVGDILSRISAGRAQGRRQEAVLNNMHDLAAANIFRTLNDAQLGRYGLQSRNALENYGLQSRNALDLYGQQSRNALGQGALAQDRYKTQLGASLAGPRTMAQNAAY